jgi:tight adherence protein B
VQHATIIICGAAAWTALCLLVADWLYGQQRRVRLRVQRAVAGSMSTHTEAAALFRGFDQADTATARVWLRVQDFVRQSGLPVTVQQVSTASLSLAALGLLITSALDRHWSLACIVGAAGVAAPWLWIWNTRRRRVYQITKLLPDAFDIMRRAVQAGQTVPSALQMAATECRKPLSQELSLCCEQQNLGLPFDSTMRELAQRVPIPEVQIFAIAMIVQRQFGSNPVEILTNISDMIRKRTRLAKRVQALTGEGRLQAIVLTILPIGVFCWLLLFRPEYIQTLIDRPKLLGVVAALQVIGTLWIRRTIRIDY